MVVKKCLNCGKEFITPKRNKKYCSHQCYCKHKSSNEIGKKYGRATILEIKRKNNKTFALCKCDCGNIFETRLDALKDGTTYSCGCYHHDLCKQGTKPIEHGMTDSRLYNVWQGMKQRCYYPKHNRYNDYGGRGIRICEEWKHSFQAFYSWAIQNGYDKNAKRNQCTIDRINVNGNYEPDNCRWVSQSVQNINKRKGTK